MNRRNRTIAVVAIAVAMAGAASYGVYRTVQRIPVREVEVASYKVLVAAKALPLGTRLTDTDVKLVAWPASSRLAQGFSEVKQVVDRGLLAAVVENEPLTEAKLAPLSAGAGLSPTIPEGMRAISVKVNEVVGVAGFVVPGTKVDVLVTMRQQQQSMTTTVVTNAQVLTAGPRYDQEKSKDGQPIPSTVVTLLVTPGDAERVALAQAEGKLMLALRNPLDTEVIDTPGAQSASLFRKSAAEPVPTAPRSKAAAPRRVEARPAPAAAPPKPYTVEAIKAAKRTTEEIHEVIR